MKKLIAQAWKSINIHQPEENWTIFSWRFSDGTGNAWLEGNKNAYFTDDCIFVGMADGFIIDNRTFKIEEINPIDLPDYMLKNL